MSLITKERDLIDYLAIFAPLFLSCVALWVSLWNSFWSQNIKKLEAHMAWENIKCSFLILIRNTGRKALVIKSVSLVVYDKKQRKYLEMGKRDNAWATSKDSGCIRAGEVMVIKPYYGSLYDVFAYSGHYFGVEEETKDSIVKIVVTDIDDKKWTFKTPFTFEEVDEKLQHAEHLD